MPLARERFRLDLQALPDGGAPAVVRLKRFLKAALRCYGLRCISAVQLHEGSPVVAESVSVEEGHDVSA